MSEVGNMDMLELDAKSDDDDEGFSLPGVRKGAVTFIIDDQFSHSMENIINSTAD